MSRTPCTCAEHKDGAPIELDGHAYRLDTDPSGEPANGVARWRYSCSCGGRGAWTYQSDNVPYHAWLAHLVRAKRSARRRRDLAQIEEMYS